MKEGRVSLLQGVIIIIIKGSIYKWYKDIIGCIDEGRMGVTVTMSHHVTSGNTRNLSRAFGTHSYISFWNGILTGLYLFMYLFIHLFIYLFIYLLIFNLFSFHLFIFFFIHLLIFHVSIFHYLFSFFTYFSFIHSSLFFC